MFLKLLNSGTQFRRLCYFIVRQSPQVIRSEVLSNKLFRAALDYFFWIGSENSLGRSLQSPFQDRDRTIHRTRLVHFWHTVLLWCSCGNLGETARPLVVWICTFTLGQPKAAYLLFVRIYGNRSRRVAAFGSIPSQRSVPLRRREGSHVLRANFIESIRTFFLLAFDWFWLSISLLSLADTTTPSDLWQLFCHAILTI